MSGWGWSCERVWLCSKHRTYGSWWMTNLTHNSFLCVYFNSLHVSSNFVLIIRRIDCINKTSGICHCVSVTVSCAGRKCTFRPAHETVNINIDRKQCCLPIKISTFLLLGIFSVVIVRVLHPGNSGSSTGLHSEMTWIKGVSELEQYWWSPSFFDERWSCRKYLTVATLMLPYGFSMSLFKHTLPQDRRTCHTSGPTRRFRCEDWSYSQQVTFWCRIHLWFRLMGGLQAKSMTSQRYRDVTRWRICVTMATLWQQQDGGYALLWKRFLHLQQYSHRLNLFFF